MHVGGPQIAISRPLQVPHDQQTKAGGPTISALDGFLASQRTPNLAGIIPICQSYRYVWQDVEYGWKGVKEDTGMLCLRPERAGTGGLQSWTKARVTGSIDTHRGLRYGPPFTRDEAK